MVIAMVVFPQCDDEQSMVWSNLAYFCKSGNIGQKSIAWHVHGKVLLANRLILTPVMVHIAQWTHVSWLL